MHIIAGVPSTTTLLDLAGVPLTSTTSRRRQFQVDGKTYADLIGEDKPSPGMPSQEGMDRVAEHARACGEINYVGTVLALACFVRHFLLQLDQTDCYRQLPLLATTSTSPALHHLSSVAASNPAPCRTIYSETKAAAMMAVESCRVECEGCGVRLFCELISPLIRNASLTNSQLCCPARLRMIFGRRLRLRRLVGSTRH